MFHAQYFALIILDYIPETVQISPMSILDQNQNIAECCENIRQMKLY